jgi:Leucine-rich repeat (LRR) protein
MSFTNECDLSLEAGILPLSEDWFSNFNDLARTSSSAPDAPSRRPALSPSQSRALASLPSSWPQQLLDAFISVHRNSEKGLSLVSKGIQALPEQLGALKSLETIFLNGNQLETFPESVGELARLSMLFAHNNQLSRLPVSLSRLEYLRFLDLHNNKLESLPSNFGESLHRLTELILFKNALRSLPPSIVGMKSVVKLELQYNRLSELPEEIGALVTLQVLNVAHNELEALPDSLGLLVHLARLDLSHNRLVGLPSSMASLKMLQSLWVDSNELAGVPPVICSLESLNLLSLRSNAIGPSLPLELAKLSKLCYIWMNDNRIELLPEAIACMNNLQDLYLSNNPCFRMVPSLPGAQINPNPIPIPSTRSSNLPSLCTILAKQLIALAKANAPPSFPRTSSIIPLLHVPEHELIPDVIDLIDTDADLCTHCLEPCWGFGKEHVYEEEWYPGQFIRIGWRHCYWCSKESSSTS